LGPDSEAQSHGSLLTNQKALALVRGARTNWLKYFVHHNPPGLNLKPLFTGYVWVMVRETRTKAWVFQYFKAKRNCFQIIRISPFCKHKSCKRFFVDKNYVYKFHFSSLKACPAAERYFEIMVDGVCKRNVPFPSCCQGKAWVGETLLAWRP
jgi:hypothetical protein